MLSVALVPHVAAMITKSDGEPRRCTRNSARSWCIVMNQSTPLRSTHTRPHLQRRRGAGNSSSAVQIRELSLELRQLVVRNRGGSGGRRRPETKAAQQDAIRQLINKPDMSD